MKKPRHYSQLILLSLLTFVLSGCFYSEYKERKAYHEFLTIHALPAKGTLVAYPNPADTKAMGRYGDSYKIVTDYTDKLNQQMNELQEVIGQLKTLQNLSQLQQNWQSLDDIKQVMLNLSDAQKAIYRDAITHKNAYKLPADTQQLFNQFFHQKITENADFMDRLIIPILDAIVTYKKIGQFLDKNRGNVEIKGSIAVINHEQLHDQFNAMLDEMNGKQTALLNAINNAVKTVQGQ